MCSYPRPLCFVHSLTPPYRVHVEWDETATSGLTTGVGVSMENSDCAWKRAGPTELKHDYTIIKEGFQDDLYAP